MNSINLNTLVIRLGLANVHLWVRDPKCYGAVGHGNCKEVAQLFKKLRIMFAGKVERKQQEY